MRLIDADVYADKMREKQKECEDLIKEADDNSNWSDRDHWEGVFATFVEAKLTLDNMPTVDAVPVVHGRWLDSNLWFNTVVCSECGEPVEDGEPKFKYCPYCGAKMDREKVSE